VENTRSLQKATAVEENNLGEKILEKDKTLENFQLGEKSGNNTQARRFLTQAYTLLHAWWFVVQLKCSNSVSSKLCLSQMTGKIWFPSIIIMHSRIG